jgi:hypothetical protein
MKKNKPSIKTVKVVRPLTEGVVKNNQEKPLPNIDKKAILKPPPAKPKK